MIVYGGGVYIMVNKHHTVFYVGVGASISNRIAQHGQKVYSKSFTARYNIEKIVYYELFDTIVEAIAREKQIKKYSRVKKIQLILSKNPGWKD